MHNQKKNNAMTIQKRNRFTDTENKFMVPKGEREGEGINQKA